MRRERPRQWPKRIRLDRDNYDTPNQIISITITCHNRHPFFKNQRFALACLEALRGSSDRFEVDVLGYCLMPDHVHLLLQQRNEINVIDFVQSYKSYTTRLAWKYGFNGRIWQRSFYDHILREHEDPMRYLRYIIENPIRAGLAKTWDEYPYSGSLTFDLDISDW